MSKTIISVVDYQNKRGMMQIFTFIY